MKEDKVKYFFNILKLYDNKNTFLLGLLKYLIVQLHLKIKIAVIK